ncbi:Methyltransferase domain-containing protein [Actinopolyspora xinjiangensis]|uniref:Methyltransferase domain-containing protein n=1 Tax=Actinopolyspora xinjiangensis TaxID=405564 RepID=A0A1H0TRU1_9ACTN|nr:class I SAM-dependent methyltransferase [Actinopolyspora xinjiangensis]SDP56515.1 Methyltransferase domain-containing protein [Actinopolyspora xinjiangensis]
MTESEISFEDKYRANRISWDASAPLHAASSFYDLEGIVAGNQPLADFEWEALGDLRGRDVVHLQCHIGSDTVALARAGADVTGLDFSPRSVEVAEELAVRCGQRMEFVTADVHEAAEVLGWARFDVVYTGKGSLGWLPDLDAWARVVAELLRPGGVLCLVEFHPVLGAAADEQPDVHSGLWLDYDYHHSAVHSHGEVTYTGDAMPEGNETFEWAHGLGGTINALIGAGMRVEALHEHESSPWLPWPGGVRDAYWFRLPPGAPRLPMLFTLRASLPG